MVHSIYADVTASITDLKRNPMHTVAAGEGATVAILNHNKPAFYCVPAALYQEMMERLEDDELNAIADQRANGPFVDVTLSDL